MWTTRGWRNETLWSLQRQIQVQDHDRLRSDPTVRALFARVVGDADGAGRTDGDRVVSKKLMMITVRGKQSRWGFEFYGDQKYFKEWLDDGLDIVLVENVIPEWVANVGLVRAWCILQDLFNFKWPWGR